MKWIVNKYSFTSLLTVFITVFVLVVFINPPLNVISWDVFGYYLYLPSFFIYNDIGLTDLTWIQHAVDTYNCSDTIYQFSTAPTGQNVNQYSMGMAFLYLPFFLIGHLFANIINYPVDGFSLPYQVAMIAGNITYFLIGLFYLRKALLEFFSDKIVAVVLLIIGIGTNYLQIVVYSGSMPHSYLFTLYTVLIWSTIKWHQTPSFKYSFLIGLMIGLITLARPTGIVSVFIPLFYNVSSWKSFKEKLALLYDKKLFLLIIIITPVLIGLPQLLYWKHLTGKYFYYSYINQGEGLDLHRPHLLKVLLSFRKGWLIYTPVMLFAVIGIYHLFKKYRFLGLAILMFFIINFYLVSSWTNWWYLNSFGQRALVESYAIMAFPLGAFLATSLNKKRLLQISTASIITLLVLLNLFQTWQFNHGIIDGTRMTGAYYFSVFGQTKQPTEKQKDLLLVERPTKGADVFDKIDQYDLVMVKEIDFENEPNNMVVKNAHSGQHAFQLTKDQNQSNSIDICFKELTSDDHAWIKASVWVYADENWQNCKLSLIATFQYKNRNYNYKGLDIETKQNIIPNQWNKIELDYLTPDVRTEDDELCVYAFLRGEKPILIDDLKIKVYNKKPN